MKTINDARSFMLCLLFHIDNILEVRTGFTHCNKMTLQLESDFHMSGGMLILLIYE